MKKLLCSVCLAGALLLAGSALADPMCTMKWSVSDLLDAKLLVLDIEAGGQFLPANGALYLEEGSFPVFGSGFLLEDNGVRFNLSAGLDLVIVVLDNELNGTAKRISPDNNEEIIGTLTFEGFLWLQEL